MSDLIQTGSVETAAANAKFNIVTTDKVREKLIRALTSTGTIPKITHIAFGTGGVDGNGNPIMPEADANALRHEVFRVPVETIEYPQPYKADIIIEITGADYNDIPLSEFGAVDAAGDFVGFQSFKTITKQDNVLLRFHWQCEF